MAKKTAIVTGGKHELVESVCVSLLDQSFHVVNVQTTLDSDIEKWRVSLKSQGYHFHVVEGDITNQTACKKVVSDVKSKFDSVDILVNCPTEDWWSKTANLPTPEWYDKLRTYLASVSEINQVAAENMAEKSWGRIVTVLPLPGDHRSSDAISVDEPFSATWDQARKFASRGITINAVSFGALTTRAMNNNRIVSDIVSKIPLNRLGQPDEVASLVAFLTSDEAAFITGVNIPINGGQHLGTVHTKT